MSRLISDRSADAVLNESFLELRAKLLEVAATLDRIDRAGTTQPATSATANRRSQIQGAIEVLLSGEPDRAATLQQLFSREYQPDWRTEMKL